MASRVYPLQSCRNVLSQVPRAKMRAVAAMVKAIHAAEDRSAAMVTRFARGGETEGDQTA